MRATLFILPALALTACGVADAGAGKDAAAAPRITRTYPLSGFTGIAAAGSETVDVQVGPAFAVRAEGLQAMLDRLDIRVENGTLKLGHKRGSWSWSDTGTPVRISVALPMLGSAALAGSGDMRVDRVSAAAFDGAVGGSGNLTLGEVQATRLTLKIGGSGDISAKGRAREAAYSLAGSGSIRAGGLAAETLTASLAGSGDIDARAASPAKVSIVGSGSVRVAGAPCTISKVGSGEATCG